MFPNSWAAEIPLPPSFVLILARERPRLSIWQAAAVTATTAITMPHWGLIDFSNDATLCRVGDGIRNLRGLPT